MAVYSAHDGGLSNLSPHSLEYSDEEAGIDVLNSPSSQQYLQCPLYKAPRCFKTVLVRWLELGESNFIPTNWRGFSDYFKLHEHNARSADELVEVWAVKHPYRREHTLLQVVAYARSTQHVKLLHHFHQALQDHLVAEETWTDDPAQCFKTCHSCVPLQRANSKSSDDIHTPSSPSNSQGEVHTHRRTHSLPKDIQIRPKCQFSDTHHYTPCGQTTGSNVTNIFMSCSCRNSPFTPSATSPASPLSSYLCKPPTVHSTVSLVTTATTPSSHLSKSPALPSAVSPNTSPSPHLCQSPTIPGTTHCSNEDCGNNTLNSPVTSEEGDASVFPEQNQLHRGGQDVDYSSVGARRRLVSDSGAHVSPPKRKMFKKRLHSSTDLVGRGISEKQTSLSESQLCASSEGVNRNLQVGEGLTNKEEVVKALSQDGMGTEEPEKGNKGESGRVDVMHEFGRQLFDTEPYNIVQRFYNSGSREAILLIVASFFVYNGFRCILQTMCEDGGIRKIFTNRDAMLDETARRIYMLSLRILTTVISPLCLCLHINLIASKPRIPKTTFSEEEAIERMMCVHRNFSPHYEVSLVQSKPKSVFQMSGTMTKRHISSIWMSIINSVLFPALLLYIGGVKLSTKGFTEGGVCQLVTISIIRVPILDDDVHILMVLDLLLTLGVLMCVYTLKDYYYYENRIAVFAVTVGSDAETLYHEIRHRWGLLDWYCYLTVGGILFGSLVLTSVKRTIIPDPSAMLAPEDLLNLCFWISALGVVSFLGMSSNRLMKKTSLPAYVLVVILISVVNLRIDAVPPETLVIFLLVSVSGYVLSLLLSLCNCHYYHHKHTQNRTSLFFLLLSLAFIVLLPLAVVGTLYREVVHLAAFVQW